jgi:predicted transcriptional regulator
MSDKKYSDEDLRRIASIITEDMISRIDALEEGMDILIEKKVRTVMQEEFTPVRQDIELIKIAVTETNRDVHKLDLRVAKLESAQNYA